MNKSLLEKYINNNSDVLKETYLGFIRILYDANILEGNIFKNQIDPKCGLIFDEETSNNYLCIISDLESTDNPIFQEDLREKLENFIKEPHEHKLLYKLEYSIKLKSVRIYLLFLLSEEDLCFISGEALQFFV